MSRSGCVTEFPADSIEPRPTERLRTIVARRGPAGFGFTFSGPVVKTVAAGSPAAAAGLTVGARLARCGGQRGIWGGLRR